MDHETQAEVLLTWHLPHRWSVHRCAGIHVRCGGIGVVEHHLLTVRRGHAWRIRHRLHEWSRHIATRGSGGCHTRHHRLKFDQDKLEHRRVGFKKDGPVQGSHREGTRKRNVRQLGPLHMKGVA